jgi:hypothetical protein
VGLVVTGLEPVTSLSSQAWLGVSAAVDELPEDVPRWRDGVQLHLIHLSDGSETRRLVAPILDGVVVGVSVSLHGWVVSQAVTKGASNGEEPIEAAYEIGPSHTAYD